MYTQKELKRAAAHIRRLARENGLSEEDMRAEMKAAMDAGRNNPDPDVQAKWAGFKYSGPEPTVDEFVLWVSSLVKERR